MSVAPTGAIGSSKDPVYNRIVGNVSVLDRNDPLRNPKDYKVNVPSTMEKITQPLYSYQLYPALGTTTLSFFQNPASGGVTRADTNMELAAQIPAPQMFLIQGIGIDWLPGMTAAAPVQLGAAAIAGATNDMFSVLRAGQFEFIIGTKQYLSMAPLMSLPPRSHFDGAFATSDATTAAAALNLRFQVPFVNGPVFTPVPLLLEAGQNFRININFPGGAIALPSGDALARIGVILYGTLYRPAQ